MPCAAAVFATNGLLFLTVTALEREDLGSKCWRARLALLTGRHHICCSHCFGSWRFFFNLKQCLSRAFILYVGMFVSVWIHMFHEALVKVRKRPCAVDSLHQVGSGTQTHVARTGSKYLYRLNCLTSPKLFTTFYSLVMCIGTHM